MVTRWQGWFAAIVVTLVTVTLVILDLTDDGFRRWWVRHALTTDTVSGVLVLLVTLLVVDQLVRRQQISDRARAVAAQAAIMLNQATRSATAMSSMLAGTGERGDAADEVRTTRSGDFGPHRLRCWRSSLPASESPLAQTTPADPQP